MTRYEFHAAIGEFDYESLEPNKNKTKFFVNLSEAKGARRSQLKGSAGSLISKLNVKNLYPSEEAVDLLLLALMVFAADTFVKRKVSSQDGWTRELKIILPVKQVSEWNQQATSIERLLKFLTGDLWKIAFRQRPEDIIFIDSPSMLNQPEYENISLFSGGVDSLIGAIDRVSTGNSLLLVGQSKSDAVAQNAQKYLSNRLKECFDSQEIEYIHSNVGLMPRQFGKNIDGNNKENTQRSRSFLFYSIANLVGSCFDTPKSIWVPENGLISLNVPLDFTRLGALSTRTVHPHTLSLMNSILDGLGSNCRLENPYQFKTKGEMVRECKQQELLLNFIDASMSCSHPYAGRYRKEIPMHCGYCVPCLIRRAALVGVADKTKYSKDVLDETCWDTVKAEGQSIRSFQMMIEKLEQDSKRAKFLVHKPGPLDDADGQYAEMFKRGIMEVAQLLDGVKVGPSK